MIESAKLIESAVSSKKILGNNIHMDKISSFVADLSVCSNKERSTLFRDIIGSGYIAGKVLCAKYPCSYAPISHDRAIKFCKNTIRVALSIGKKKFNNIIANHAVIVKKAHGNTGRIMNKKNINELKQDCKQFILQLASQQGESHATRFIRECNKIFMRDGEVDTVKLPSYLTKSRIHRNHCWSKGWRIASDARGAIIVSERLFDDEYPEVLGRYPIISWPAFHTL